MRAYLNRQSPANLKRCAGLFFSGIILSVGLAAAAIVHARDEINITPAITLELARADNAQQAAAIAKQQYGGKVLKVVQVDGGYRVKLLLPSGKVKTVFVSSTNS